MDDKLIEVVGMYSSLHIGTIQVSLAEPLRIGQASEVKVCVCACARMFVSVWPNPNTTLHSEYL